MNIAVITPTRDRPRGLELCEYWLSRQTYKNFQWIVVDDGDEFSEKKALHDLIAVNYVHRKRQARDPEITNAVNIFAGVHEVAAVGCDALMYLEDDDWVSPDFLANMACAIYEHDVCVVSGLRHYHAGRRKYQDKRMDPRVLMKARKSMGCFMVRRDSVIFDVYKETLKWCIENSYPLIDIMFWRASAKVLGLKCAAFSCDDIVLIKGIPGRAITKKHRDLSGHTDADGRVLRSWVGLKDAEKILHAARGWEEWKEQWEHEEYKG